MANVTTTNPLILDTVGEIYTFPINIKKIVWTGIVTNGDDLIFKDKLDGNIVIQGKGNAGEDWILENINVAGLYLDVITSGKLIIYLK